MKKLYIWLWPFVAALLAAAGCGGGGLDTVAGLQSGVYGGTLNSRAGGRLDMQILASGGTITSGFAMLTASDNQTETSNNVSGTITPQLTTAVITFEDGDVLNLTFSNPKKPLAGTYTITIDGQVTEQGDVTLTRVGASTPNVGGKYSGTYLVTSDESGANGVWEVTLAQSGNTLTLTGQVDGESVTGSGSVVGNRTSFGTLSSESGSVDWSGTFSGNSISGTFSTGLVSGTFTGTKDQ